MVPAVDTCEYLVRQRFKRRVKAVTFDNCETTNIYRQELSEDNQARLYIFVSKTSLGHSYSIQSI